MPINAYLVDRYGNPLPADGLPMTAVSGAFATGSIVDLATLLNRIIAGTADGTAPGMLGMAVYNGTNWDRIRSVNAAINTSGAGVLAAAALLWDSASSTYVRPFSAKSFGDGDSGALFGSVGLEAWNGSNYDRLRTLAASGYGLGVALHSGAMLHIAASATYTQINAGYTIIPTQAEAGIQRRGYVIQNTGDQPIACAFYAERGGSGSGIGAVVVLNLTISAGGLVSLTGNHLTQLAGTCTVAAGDISELLNPMYLSALLVTNTGAALTSGGCKVDYTAET